MKFKYVMLDISDKKEGFFTVGTARFYFERKNTQRVSAAGKPMYLVNHHTAGSPTTIYDDYHFNVTEVGGVVYIFKTLKWSELGQHLWKRNTGTLGFTLCCMATPKDKPTANMLEALATLEGEVCAWRQLDPKSNVTLGKKSYRKLDHRLDLVDVPGSISVPVITDHSFFGKSDGYGNVDIKDHIAKVRTKAIEVYQSLKAGKSKFLFESILKNK